MLTQEQLRQELRRATGSPKASWVDELERRLQESWKTYKATLPPPPPSPEELAKEEAERRRRERQQRLQAIVGGLQSALARLQPKREVPTDERSRWMAAITERRAATEPRVAAPTVPPERATPLLERYPGLYRPLSAWERFVETVFRPESTVAGQIAAGVSGVIGGPPPEGVGEPKGLPEHLARILGTIGGYTLFGGPLRAPAALAAGRAAPVVARVSPRVAGVLPSVVGEAAVVGAPPAAGALTSPELTTRQAVEEAVRAGVEGIVFGLAREIPGAAARQAVLSRLRPAVQRGRLSPALGQALVAAAGGAPVGTAMGALDVALRALHNPREFDAAVAAGDTLRQALTFAGLDALFSLLGGIHMGAWRATTEQPKTPKPEGYRNAIHRSQMAGNPHVFATGTRNPAKEGWEEFKPGSGIWRKGGEILYEMVPVGEWYVPKHEVWRRQVRPEAPPKARPAPETREARPRVPVAALPAPGEPAAPAREAPAPVVAPEAPPAQRATRRARAPKAEPQAPAVAPATAPYKPKPGERVVARDLTTGREYVGTFLRSGRRGSWVFGVLRLDDGTEKPLSLTKHTEWRPAPAPEGPPARPYTPGVGDSVRLKGAPKWGIATVVDVSDPSLAVVRLEDGREMKVGKAALEPVEVAAPAATPAPTPAPAPGEAEGPTEMRWPKENGGAVAVVFPDEAHKTLAGLYRTSRRLGKLALETREQLRRALGLPHEIDVDDLANRYRAVIVQAVRERPAGSRYEAPTVQEAMLGAKPASAPPTPPEALATVPTEPMQPARAVEVLKEAGGTHFSRIGRNIVLVYRPAEGGFGQLPVRVTPEGKLKPDTSSFLRTDRLPEGAKPIEELAGAVAPAEGAAAAGKPYVGLRPGTEAWMRVWRDYPELQNEMLEYAKRLEAAEAKPAEPAPPVSPPAAPPAEERPAAVQPAEAIAPAGAAGEPSVADVARVLDLWARGKEAPDASGTWKIVKPGEIRFTPKAPKQFSEKGYARRMARQMAALGYRTLYGERSITFVRTPAEDLEPGTRIAEWVSEASGERNWVEIKAHRFGDLPEERQRWLSKVYPIYNLDQTVYQAAWVSESTPPAERSWRWFVSLKDALEGTLPVRFTREGKPGLSLLTPEVLEAFQALRAEYARQEEAKRKAEEEKSRAEQAHEAEEKRKAEFYERVFRGHVPPGTKRRRFEITVFGDKEPVKKEVLGYVFGDIIGVNEPPKGVGGSGWAVTHLPTGLAIRTDLDLYEAVALAARLVKTGAAARLGDPKKMTKEDKAILHEVLRAHEAAEPFGRYTAEEPAAPAPRVTPAEEPAAAPLPEFRPLQLGKQSGVKTERGAAVQTRFALVEASDVVASHDTNLRPDPRYPAELQPRQRTRVASEAQVANIAANLEPEWLAESPKASEGAPIVGPDGVVESGNARVIALKRLYERGHKNAEMYRTWLAEQAERFGLEREAVERAEQPILVRVRHSDVDRVAFVHEANEAAVAAMSATEQALADAKKLTGAIMDIFHPDETGRIVTPENQEFIRLFMGEIVSPAERARYMTAEGTVSQEGIQRIRNAVFAKAYGDPAVIAKVAEDPESRIRNISNALLVVAPELAKIKEEIAEGKLYDLDITGDLAAAVRKISALRDEGRSVEAYLRTAGDLIGDIPPEARELVDILNRNSRSVKRMVGILRAYAGRLRSLGSPRQQQFGLLAQKAPTKAELLAAALKEVEGVGLQPTFFEGEAGRGPGGGPALPGVAAEAAPARERAEERKEARIRQVEAELGKRVDQVVGEVSPPAGLGIKIVGAKWPEDRGKAFRFTDDEVEARYQAAHGLRKEGFWPQLKAALVSFRNKLTREYEHLPRTAEFAPLRFELLRLSKQKGVAADRTLRIEQGIIANLLDKPNLFNLFERKVLLDDLAEEAAAGHDLPFGFTKETVERERARLDAEVAKEPLVQEALSKRKQVWDAIKADYIAAMDAIGFHVEKRFTRESYFRHQVLEYARARGPTGTGQRLRTPTGRGFLRRREGSEKDINTAYLQAEFEVMAQMLYDIEVARVIKFVEDRYSITERLKREAARQNAAELARLAEVDKEVDAALKSFRRSIAIGMGKLRNLAAQNKLPLGPEGEFVDVVEGLRTEWEGLAEALAEDIPGVGFEPSMPGMPMDEEGKKLFRYLSWLLGQEHEATPAAGMVLKAVAERRKWIKETLGKRYKTWEDVIPEGYVAWQPREGNVFYLADSIPAHLAEKLLSGALEKLAVEADDIRKVLAMGQRFPAFVVKEEVAKTLDGLTDARPDDPLTRVAAGIMRAWKSWILLSPRRWFKYNARNISGDAEAVFVGNPSAFAKVPQAMTELYKVFAGDGSMSPELREWFSRGGMQSVLQVLEIGDIEGLRMFHNLMAKHKGKLTEIPARAWQAYWRAARLSTDFREAVLRYAAYLDYLEQMRKDPKGRPRNFGASMPQEIMALDDIRDRAFWLANDLLGAYDRVSVAGRWLRTYLSPFWSWQEVNFRRYIQFIRNAASDPRAAEAVGRSAARRLGLAARQAPFRLMRLGALLIKVAGLWALLQAYNILRFPEEEASLPEEVRARPHIILGRDKDGKVLYFSRLGMLGDFLAWFGLDAPANLVSDWLNGRKSAGEIAKEMAKGPVNTLWQTIGPQYKLPAELAARRKTYPDLFRPTTIRDPGLELARTFGLEAEYRALLGLPSRPYAESWRDVFLYRVDPREAAYFDILDEKRRFLKKIGKWGEYGGLISPRSNALYNVRQALRYQDRDALIRYLSEYVNLGGTAQGLATSIRNLSPAHGLTAEEAKRFVEEWLDDEGRRKLRLAMEYYDELRADLARMLKPPSAPQE